MNLNSDINNKTKAIIYNLGLAYEEMNKPDEAVKQFKKIYEVDISYKDVAKKIEEAYKG
jgi:tetratricopeptide (TPR) repeat protein